MIAAYKKKSNYAAGAWLLSLGALLYMMSTGMIEGNIWDTGNTLGISAVIINGFSFAAALWWYAKAKGYWGILGVILMFLSLLGLIIIAMLPDKNKTETNNET